MMGDVQHPQLRDLIWAVCSPSLIKPLPGWPTAFSLDRVDEARARLEHTDTRALERHLEQRNTRFLGSYFEALWDFFFIHDPRFTVVAKNLQIRDVHHTIGEFDFIIEDHQANQHIHLELAIKFYLGFSETNALPYTDGEHIWLGPQARDRLDIKVARALEHQLTLQQHPVAQQQLQALGVETAEPQFLFKGCLFQPDPILPLPDYVPDTSHHPGAGQHAGWLCIDRLSSALNDDGPWYLLHKHHWPAPPYPDNLQNPLNANQAIERLTFIINSEQRPYMVVQTDRESASHQLLKRYFVTPDNWPYCLGHPR
jgi:hypothetical protein